MIKLNWGIVGAGNIAEHFVYDLKVNNQLKHKTVIHRVVSIGASSIEKGEKWIHDNDINMKNNDNFVPKVELYDDFYNNKLVDVVYISSPHHAHKNQVILALNGGKHVLVEKPITLDKKQLVEIYDLATKKNLFVMEGVWTRFFPILLRLKELVYTDKILGEITRLFVDFCSLADIPNLPTSHRLRDINIGASALLDIGVYAMTYARTLLDERVGKEHTKFDIKSFLKIDKTDKVDHLGAALVNYTSGRLGILSWSQYTPVKKPYATLEGTLGQADLYGENPACPEKIVIKFYDNSKLDIVMETDSTYRGFIYEANAVALDISKGKLQNDLMPLDESLLVMGMMDSIRESSGFKYPHEELI